MNSRDGGTRSIAELLVAIRSRSGSSFNHIELLTVAAPVRCPLQELVREAMSAAAEAELLKREITRLLAGPTDRAATESNRDR